MPNTIQGTQFQPKALTNNFTSTNTTMADVFSFDGLAGRKYRVRFSCILTAGAADGFKFAISGSATFTDIRIALMYYDWAGPTVQTVSQLITKDTAVGTTGPTTATVQLEGYVSVNAAGTVSVQAACQVDSTGTLLITAGAVLDYELAE